MLWCSDAVVTSTVTQWWPMQPMTSLVPEKKMKWGTLGLGKQMSMHIYFHWLILCIFICDYQLLIITLLLIEAELRIVWSIIIWLQLLQVFLNYKLWSYMCMCQLRLTLEKSIPWKQYTFHVYNTRNAHAQGGVNDAIAHGYPSCQAGGYIVLWS